MLPFMDLVGDKQASLYLRVLNIMNNHKKIVAVSVVEVMFCHPPSGPCCKMCVLRASLSFIVLVLASASVLDLQKEK